MKPYIPWPGLIVATVSECTGVQSPGAEARSEESDTCLLSTETRCSKQRKKTHTHHIRSHQINHTPAGSKPDKTFIIINRLVQFSRHLESALSQVNWLFGHLLSLSQSCPLTQHRDENGRRMSLVWVAKKSTGHFLSWWDSLLHLELSVYYLINFYLSCLLYLNF